MCVYLCTFPISKRMVNGMVLKALGYTLRGNLGEKQGTILNSLGQLFQTILPPSLCRLKCGFLSIIWLNAVKIILRSALVLFLFHCC